MHRGEYHSVIATDTSRLGLWLVVMWVTLTWVNQWKRAKSHNHINPKVIYNQPQWIQHAVFIQVNNKCVVYLLTVIDTNSELSLLHERLSKLTFHFNQVHLNTMEKVIPFPISEISPGCPANVKLTLMSASWPLQTHQIITINLWGINKDEMTEL